MAPPHQDIMAFATYAVCAIALIGDLVSIYFILPVWAYHKHKFIRSRIPPLTYNVLWIFFSLLLLCIANAMVHNFFDFWKVTYFFIINDAIQYGCTFAYATRAWILFYHVEWSYESINHIWRTQLAQVEVALERANTIDKDAKGDSDAQHNNKLIQRSQFYITYRDSLGNYKKVFPFVMCLLLPLFIFLLDILPLIILDLVNTPYSHMHRILLKAIHIFCFLVIILIILNLIHRIGQISDKYGIGQELKRLNICFACFILSGRIIEISIISTSNMDVFAFEFIASICSMLSILCALYISSFLVLRRLFMDFLTPNTLKRMEDNQKQGCLLQIVTMGVNIQLKKSLTQTKIDANRLTLNQVLSSKIGFETFTQFLISELSVENMLFLVEVKQYKASCRKYHRQEHGSPVPDPEEKEASTVSPHFKPLAPSDAPTLRSSTTTKSKPDVFRSHSVMEVNYIPGNALLQSLNPYDYALYLYHKYVTDGSDLQINIPSKTRRALTKFMIKTAKTDIILMDDYTDQMFRLYDKAWEQIHTLMKSDSFLRFKKTKEYQNVCLHAQKEQEKERQKRNSGNGGDATNELFLKPSPSILDWPQYKAEGAGVPIMLLKSHETVGSGTIVSIPEQEEVDHLDNIDADLEKLNSIAKYDTQRTAQVKKEMRSDDELIMVDELEDILMEVLDDIESMDSEESSP